MGAALSHAVLVIVNKSHEINPFHLALIPSLPAAIHVRHDLLLLAFHHDCESSPAMWYCKSNKPLSFVHFLVLSLSLSAA